MILPKFPKNCMKMEKNLGRMGVRAGGAPLGSATASYGDLIGPFTVKSVICFDH